MKLGLSMRVTQEVLYHETRDSIAHDWYEFLEYALPDVDCYLIPNMGEKSLKMVKSLDLGGLILTGGNDIGESQERDQTEKLLINYFHENDLPIIGICRGLQMLYVWLGGQLSHCSSDQHVGCRHQIYMTPMADMCIKNIEVNSYHNYGIKLSSFDMPEAEVFAKSLDGFIEGILWDKNKFMGLMWHPEREEVFSEHDKQFFRWHLGLGKLNK